MTKLIIAFRNFANARKMYLNIIKRNEEHIFLILYTLYVVYNSNLYIFYVVYNSALYTLYAVYNSDLYTLYVIYDSDLFTFYVTFKRTYERWGLKDGEG